MRSDSAPRPNPAARFLDLLRGRLALALLVVLLALSALEAATHLAGRPFDADLASLLPDALAPELSPGLEAKLRDRLAKNESNSIAALVTVKQAGASGAQLDADARRAALAFEAKLLENPAVRRGTFEGASGLPALPRAAGNLLTDADRRALEALTALPTEAAAERLAARAAACLSPASPRLLGFTNDPFCTFDHWLLERLAALPWTKTTAQGRDWVAVKRPDPGERTLLLLFSADEKAVAAGEAGLARSLAAAKAAAAEAAPGADALAAGVPLFTDAIASRAEREVAIIGIVSTVGVLVVAWLLFGRFATVAAMSVTVAAGFLMALALTFALFGTLSLVTFIFGATLIGVSVDYSSHWMALKRPGESPWERRRRLLTPLLLAAGSSAAAYAALLLTPLPGLRQMAVLAAAGLLGALFTVLALLPFCERLAPKRTTRLMAKLETALPRIPHLDSAALRRPAVLGALALFATLLIFGLTRLEFASGIRDLQGAPASLIAEQRQVAETIRMPSPAQAFVIEGATIDEALEKEVHLRARLAADPALRHVTPAGLSEWLPPALRQNADRALVRKALDLAEPTLEALLGARPAGPGGRALTEADVAATPLKRLLSQYVLTDGSSASNGEKSGAALLLTLAGVAPGDLGRLASAAADLELPGVHFVDITRGMGDGLSLYRDRVLVLLALGLAALWAVLVLRFRGAAWRAVAPTVIGILTAAAVLGAFGIPFTLFAALAMVLLTGLGVDYGIFLTGNPNDGRTGAATLFSGVTTMLSFGLLAFSSTPALSVFGLTVLTGQAAIWAATPLLRPKRSPFAGPAAEPPAEN
ncbi:MMPL family transporter [uncultured Sutterella sp.]|uniref:MMPL family transporter n=1 Tax=uncultured Sutterella sp. TaxID=286133 RepID=UPI0025E4F608|nr:MMPL family transporter [uncultured Sutterella sp.]